MTHARNLTRFFLLLLFVAGAATTACSSDPADENTCASDTDCSPEPDQQTMNGCASNAECTDPATPWCDSSTGECSAPPTAGLIGWGDGSSESVGRTQIQAASSTHHATGLEFNPMRPEELWVIERQAVSTEPCDSANATFEGCTALEGVVAIITNPGADDSSTIRRVDGNSWHFMRRPTGLAFGEGDTFATCGEARTGNYLDDAADYIGPSLWSSDLEVFAQDPGPGLNGSHLDMLHATPWCMGIAHETGNAYWTFNGDIGALDRYDFNADHGPGSEDHSDGELKRYNIGAVLRVPEIPSHMVFHHASDTLFIADTGNSRVVRLDPNTGTPAGSAPVFEAYQSNEVIAGADLTELVPPGTLARPSGMVLHEDILYVSDNTTGVIHAFDLEGNELRSLQTGLPEGELSALAVGPDGKLYIASLKDSTVTRIDPEAP